jgi:dTDP-4-dehydrorhamnose reductase
MLGHRLWAMLSDRHEAYGTVRRDFTDYPRLAGFDRARAVEQVRVEELESVGRAIRGVRPDVIVNCVGLVKQVKGNRPEESILVNSLFPHQLATLCQEHGARLIQLSTDCVFSGQKGMYRESDQPDAEDLYGRSKLLGEVAGDGCLTLRTSMIGRELGTSRGLVEWFLAQQGKTVQGYRRAVFSGFTTDELSSVIAAVIDRHRDLQGLWHVAADPIDKYELLRLVKDAYRANVVIEPTDDVVCDRSLDGSRFRAATGLVAPPWPAMIARMAALDDR